MQCLHQIQLKTGISVPCGKCSSCLANKRSEWVFRLKQEYLSSDFSLFVTLTYDDEHLPLDLSVSKKDIQLFLKRLRKKYPSRDIRYFVVAEYGDHTFRPHYHGLFFFKQKYEINSVYQTFLDSWKNGFCKFGEVEEGSIVYCTKYCMKLTPLPYGRKEVFTLMSKMNGGLGFSYLQKMSNYHLKNEQFQFVSEGGRIYRMPRYYRNKLGHVRDRQKEFDEMYGYALHDFNKRYSEFVRFHGRVTPESNERAFNEFQKQRTIRIDELAQKHVKKQNNF